MAETEPEPLDAFLPLTAAESAVAAAMAAGQADGNRDRSRPEQHETERAVRAEVLRILLLDADPRYPSHEKGLRLTGAIITGLLDLEGCRIPRDIQLRRCRFESAPVLRSAIIDNLFLDGSLLPGLRAEGMQARGVLSLREAEIVGTVQLTGSRLGGYLNADRATVDAANGIAVEAGGIETGGSLLLREASCTGSVNFSGCRIGGDVSLAGGRFVRPGGLAVNGDGATMRGDILLRAARIEGETRLCGAQVGGNVDCSGCRLENSSGDALNLNRARVQGVFFLQHSAVMRGRLDLTASVIGAIHDEPDSWPQEGQLSLNRCRYGAIIHGPVDARSRLDWLARQIPAVWPEFLPQPYEQLATVLREMGHQDDARTVMVEKERLQRLARRQRTKAPLLKFTYFVSDWVLALTVRYGHQPLYAFIWLLCFWVAGALVFEAAAHTGALQPNAPVMLRSLEWTMCAVEIDETRYMPTQGETLPGRAAIGQSQFDCFLQQPEAQSYPPFHPWMYSLDTLLPVTSLGQREFWRPSPETGIGVFALNYYYLQSVIGWSLSLLAVAGFSGIVKSR